MRLVEKFSSFYKRIKSMSFKFMGFRLMALLVSYFLSLALFDLIVGNVNPIRFLYFWLAVDAITGLTEAITSKVCIYLQNGKDEFVEIIYLLTMCGFAAVSLVFAWIF